MFDTVAAVSTPRGKGGIAVIRISGEKTPEILKKVFCPAGKAPWDNPRFAAFGEIANGDGEVVDTGIATFFETGKSFTGEASAEISCHGGIAVTKAVLEAVFSAGAVPAPAGEFTKRAFINGKLSLTEAEAVGKLIDADTDSRRKLASGAARGKLREKTESVRKELTAILASLYAVIDYPDEDIGDEGEKNIENVLCHVREELTLLLKTYKTGSAVANGVVTAICGSPNSGKSSLYNLLCGEERAIVTDIAGTTRDTLWETVDADGITLRIADTAGIRETGDKIEEMGVERALSCMESAELVITVFDGSRPLSDDDKRIIGSLSEINTPRISVVNKSDKGIAVEREKIAKVSDKTVVMSAKTKEGTEELFRAVREVFNEDGLSLTDDALLWDARHKATVEASLEKLTQALEGLRRKDPADAVCSLAESALAELSLLDGRGITDEIVGEIFSRFCVGK